MTPTHTPIRRGRGYIKKCLCAKLLDVPLSMKTIKLGRRHLRSLVNTLILSGAFQASLVGDTWLLKQKALTEPLGWPCQVQYYTR